MVAKMTAIQIILSQSLRHFLELRIRRAADRASIGNEDFNDFADLLTGYAGIFTIVL
jgi:hypothetical protein